MTGCDNKDYLPTQVDAKALSRLIWQHFEIVSKPDWHFRSTGGFYEKEFLASNSLDLSQATISDIQPVYESNTFYSAEGRKYRTPRMFDLLLRLGQDAAHLDFISAFFDLPTCCRMASDFKTYTREQKYCVWLIQDCLDLHFERIRLFDHDAFLHAVKTGQKSEAVDADAVEMLSQNLFGSKCPPMKEIRAFSKMAG